jgi:hypothetical protein
MHPGSLFLGFSLFEFSCSSNNGEFRDRTILVDKIGLALWWKNIVSTLLRLGICSLTLLLAHYIAVNTSHRSFGYYKPRQTNPHCIRLVIWRKWETLTFSFYSSVVGSILIWSYHARSHVISWHAQSAPDHLWDSFQSWFIEKLEDLTGTSNTLLWSRYFHNWDHH